MRGEGCLMSMGDPLGDVEIHNIEPSVEVNSMHSWFYCSSYAFGEYYNVYFAPVSK